MKVLNNNSSINGLNPIEGRQIKGKISVNKYTW